MFQRIANLFKALLNVFVTDLEKRNPEALLALEKENLRKQIAQYNEGLASHATLAERLMTQVRRLEKETQETRAKINANVQAGNRSAAGQYALQLQEQEQFLSEQKQQVEQAETTYHNLVTARDQAVSAAKAKIEAIKTSINEMKVQQAMADMSEMAAGMNSSIGSSGDTLDRLQQMVQDERDQSAGRTRVAQDAMTQTDVQLKQSEQEALAEAALKAFMSQEGKQEPSALTHKKADFIEGEMTEPQKNNRDSVR